MALWKPIQSLRQIRKRYNAISSLASSHPLTKDRPLGALKRYGQYHLLDRFLPDAALFPFVNELKIVSRPGMGYIGHNFYVGLYDFEEMGFLLHFLRPTECFVDVGANAGAYSLLAAGVCGAFTMAIEPVPATFETLMLNLRVNNLQDMVSSHNIGVGDDETQLHFSIAKHNAWNHVVLDPAAQRDTVVVDVMTLDSLVASTPPVLIKVDVEGYECAVLRGATKTLANPMLKAIIIELNGSGTRFGFQDSEVHERLFSSGFEPFSYDPLTRTVNRLDSFNRDKANTLYLRDVEFVQQRIETAKSFRVLGKQI